MIDLERRKRVMDRSMRLGHCICNPKKPCPCDIFLARDVCLCAGERLEDSHAGVRLTQLVENAGCASKINQDDLKKILAGLPEVSDPRLLVGSNTCDDAGVYLMDDGVALVQTVDVFTPTVDDPYVFGQIAAANSLSDVYAMGGRPLTALSVVGFPIDTLSHEVMTEMLRGGADKMREAGVLVVGGHSIKDPEIKFGFAVTGIVAPAKMITNAGGQPGDVLILTKPLGTGAVSFAGQLGRASRSAQTEVAASMTELNRVAAEIMTEVGVHAATDVTGFGLLGHLSEMAVQSRVTAEVFVERVPLFADVIDYLAQGMVSGAAERNREYASGRVVVGEGISEELLYALCDPQTSGGLLIAVPEEKTGELLDRLHGAGILNATAVGRIVEKSEGRMLLKHSPEPPIPSEVHMASETLESTEPSCCAEAATPCCDSPPDPGAGNAVRMKARFSEFMHAVNTEGAISVRTKELMAVALALVTKCAPCLRIHLAKARGMGITEDEIAEAVFMAVSFGGAPALMFYESGKEE